MELTVHTENRWGSPGILGITLAGLPSELLVRLPPQGWVVASVYERTRTCGGFHWEAEIVSEIQLTQETHIYNEEYFL